MANILSFIQAHLLALGPIFVFVSLVLTGIGTLLRGLGKTVPGWLGSVASALGSIVHFLNGNVAAAVTPSAPIDPSAPAATPAA